MKQLASRSHLSQALAACLDVFRLSLLGRVLSAPAGKQARSVAVSACLCPSYSMHLLNMPWQLHVAVGEEPGVLTAKHG